MPNTFNHPVMSTTVRWTLNCIDMTRTGHLKVLYGGNDDHIMRLVTKEALKYLPIDYQHRAYSVTWAFCNAARS